MIGAVGPDADAFADAIEAAGGSAVAGSAEAVLDAGPAAVVAVGGAAAADLVRAGVDVPVLPVEAGPGLGSRSREAALDVVDGLLEGEYATRTHPVLGVDIGGRATRALFDVTLMTREPGRISEYEVSSDGARERFRADGVVVATPAGSRGYANAAGGPRIGPGVAAVAVVPVAAFATRVDRRVVEPPVEVTVERDEHEVSLAVDGGEREAVPPGRPVEVSVAGAVVIADPE